jgi:putative transposase
MRYIEMNPVRAGMVNHPAEYRWTSYAANALGVDNAVVTPHAEYLALGASPSDRQAVYRGLFDGELSTEELTLLRGAVHSGTPLGNDKFREQIEAALGRKMGWIRRGRPRAKRP